MRTGRPRLPNSQKQLSGSRNAKTGIETSLVPMQTPELPPTILKGKSAEMWEAFITPLAKANILLETDRIAATVIADCMGSLFETKPNDKGVEVRVEDKERRLLSETLLDFLNAFGLTSRSREAMGIKPILRPESRER